jgi:hypothetical protein
VRAPALSRLNCPASGRSLRRQAGRQAGRQRAACSAVQCAQACAAVPLSRVLTEYAATLKRLP